MAIKKFTIHKETIIKELNALLTGNVKNLLISENDLTAVVEYSNKNDLRMDLRSVFDIAEYCMDQHIKQLIDDETLLNNIFIIKYNLKYIISYMTKYKNFTFSDLLFECSDNNLTFSIDTSSQSFVRDCIDITSNNFQKYWNNICMKNFSTNSYEQFSSKEELEKAFRSTMWREVRDKDIKEGFRVFKANISGRLNVIPLESLPDDVTLVALGKNSSNDISLCVSNVKGKLLPYTYLITGDSYDKKVVFNFHPGKPYAATKISNDTLKHGDKISKKDALNLGFKLIRIV